MAPARHPALPDAIHRPLHDQGGVEVVIRPIRPKDEPLLVQLHGTLSDRSVSLCATSTR